MKNVHLVSLLIFASLVHAENAASEPMHEGRAMSSWFLDLGPCNLHDNKEVYIKADKARVAFREMGSDTIPYLLTFISYNQSSENISRSSYAFWGLGNHAAPAVPELSKRFLRNKKPVESAGSALAGIGTPDAISALSKGLNHPEWGIRISAVSALGELREEAEAQIPSIIRATKDKDHRVRHEAVIALGQIKRRTDISIPALVECLKDPNPYVWEQTIRVLREFGRKAKAATPSLLSIHERHSDDFGVTFSIKYTLEKTDPQAAKKLR